VKASPSVPIKAAEMRRITEIIKKKILMANSPE